MPLHRNAGASPITNPTALPSRGSTNSPRRAARLSLRLAALAAAVPLTLAATGCIQSAPPPFDLRAMQTDDRAALQNQITPEMPALPTTEPASSDPAATRPTAQVIASRESFESRPIVELPLQEIIDRSVAYNPEVAVAAYDPPIAATKVGEAEGKFGPISFTSIKLEHDDTPEPGNFIDNFAGTVVANNITFEQHQDTYTFQTGIKQQLSTGAQVQLSYSMTNNYFEPQQSKINPYWQDMVKLEVTQPLLRNFGQDVNYAQMNIARNDARISVLDFRKTLEDNVASIEKDYWQLVEAFSEVKIDEDLVKQSHEETDLLGRRRQLGIEVTADQTSQALAATRSREADLLRARNHLLDLSADLKQRMNDPAFPVTGAMVIQPADQPIDEPIRMDLADQIDAALENRLELGQQMIRIDSATIAQVVAKNGLLPELDIDASIGWGGVGSTESTAWTNQNQGNRPTLSLSIDFQVPIGNESARAVFRRSQLQRIEAILGYRDLESKIELDVETAYRELSTSWDELGARRASRLAAEDELYSIIERQKDLNVPQTAESVRLKLQAQEDLAGSQRDEATAVANYNIAIEQLERAKGTLLRYNNIILQEDSRMPQVERYGDLRGPRP